MEGFSYNNIFETKGIEYLIIIAFLVLIIPFWLIINRQAGVTTHIRNAFRTLTADILKVPKGLFYSSNHTWTHLEKSGIAKVGLDDFLLHVIGEVKFRDLKSPGNYINKGDLLADIDHDGKLLQIYSPLSGTIIKTNALLYESPGVVNDDPYGEGWIYSILPSEWIADTGSYYLADDAIAWSKNELDRLKDFLAMSMEKYSPQPSMVILQDGGELCDQPLSELPNEVWRDFQKSFLNPS